MPPEGRAHAERRPSKLPRCTRRSTEDILKVRDPTRTIETLDFQYGKAKFRVIDVGGQRMERPKWNLTGEITAVIFVCALTEYNQVYRPPHPSSAPSRAVSGAGAVLPSACAAS